MSPKTLTALRLKPELLEAMRQVKQTEGIPMTVQIEKAVEEWLKKRGIVLKSDRKRVDARKRP